MFTIRPTTGERKTIYYSVRAHYDVRGSVFSIQRGDMLVEITLVNIPVSKYEAPLVWEVCYEQLNRVGTGEIPFKVTTKIRFTPQRDGIYCLAATAGSSARGSNRPLGAHGQRSGMGPRANWEVAGGW